ncbi:hypothetical protein [Actinomycetospora sp. TBRC 11914]|uniref:hypothetical protein n=1 Tax=Actinomycetospora sp. TBRC 11914 TaxID=2729387 RepID=UPI00145CC6F0|nr:hypothetical protein [Actinomycetospora sp. TBRC 11914]NMO93348.1 hypothetical protein [Actinomycetospora sp. TBRC 11914]
MTGPGGGEADREARERLSREARATATALLDWVGTRVDGVATARPDAAARPRQSAGPCTWCPVCALIAAVRGEQPELTAHLAEQASALLVVLRLLVQAHVHEQPGHEQPGHEQPGHEQPGHGHAGSTGSDAPRPPEPDREVPWDVAPHAHFDPEPAAPAPPGPDDGPRPAPERPTGKRGPRPSPRHGSAGASPAGAEPPPPAPTPAPAPTTAPVATGTRTSASPAPTRPTRGVQRIPVRRRPRPC